MATQWPDITADNVAFAQAKATLGPGASLSEIAQCAQSIKLRMVAHDLVIDKPKRKG